MRMLLNVHLPHEPFSEYVRQGTIGEIMEEILDEIKPEATYFTEHNGNRSMVMIVDVTTPDRVPAFAEPWFLKFKAQCEFRVIMDPAELQRAGLKELGQRWS